MSRDFTIVPQDYIVHHIKTDDLLVRTKDGDYAYHVKTEQIPLILCRECKYYEAKEDWCYWRDEAITADDFCSYGKVSEKPTGSERSSE